MLIVARGWMTNYNVTVPQHTCRYGLYRSDHLLYNDPELCFKETIPQSALFDPTTNQAYQTESGSEDEEGEGDRGGSEMDAEGTKPKSSGGSSSSPPNPVPLGWPKVCIPPYT